MGPPGPAGDAGPPGQSVTAVQLDAGHPSCPFGGTAFTAVSGTTYACNGKPASGGAGSSPQTALAHCAALRAAGVTEDGKYWVQPNGSAPMEVWCDMSTSDGGWTLVYAYTFTDYANFGSLSNAVTPRPSWSATSANVPVSISPPTNEEDFNAIAFARWTAFAPGSEFLVKSSITNWLACLPGTGSLLTYVAGTLSCRVVNALTGLCVTTAPTSLSLTTQGPYLGGIQVYWDGSTTANYPTHDPCGANGQNQLNNVPDPRGAILVR
jgi:hypothetical protein